MGKRQSAGEGSVYQRHSDGRWVVQFRDLQRRTRHRYRDPRGRRLENKTHARQALRAYLQQRGEGVGGDDPRLAEWTAWWLAQLDLRPTTIADYRYKIGLLPGWLTRKRLAQITPMDVHEALAELASSETVHGKPRAGSTVAQVRTVLGNCLHVAERYGHVTRNAARLAAPVTYQHAEVDPLDVGEARALLKQVAGHRLGSLFTVALALGLRQGECVGLKWSDVDLEAGTLSVMRQITRTNEHVEAEGDPKTRRSRRSLILPRVCVDQPPSPTPPGGRARGGRRVGRQRVDRPRPRVAVHTRHAAFPVQPTPTATSAVRTGWDPPGHVPHAAPLGGHAPARAGGPVRRDPRRARPPGRPHAAPLPARDRLAPPGRGGRHRSELRCQTNCQSLGPRTDSGA
jgi:hypothetical protein